MLKWGSSLDGVNILLENKHQMFFLVKILETRDCGLTDRWPVCVIWGTFFHTCPPRNVCSRDDGWRTFQGALHPGHPDIVLWLLSVTGYWDKLIYRTYHYTQFYLNGKLFLSKSLSEGVAKCSFLRLKGIMLTDKSCVILAINEDFFMHLHWLGHT